VGFSKSNQNNRVVASCTRVGGSGQVGLGPIQLTTSFFHFSVLLLPDTSQPTLYRACDDVMVNDSIGGVRLNCLITAWASVVNVGLCCDVMSPQQDAATGIVCILFIYLPSCVCNKTQWQCCKSRWLPVSTDFSPSEELASYKAMRVPSAVGEARRTDKLLETLDTNCGVFVMP